MLSKDSGRSFKAFFKIDKNYNFPGTGYFHMDQKNL